MRPSVLALCLCLCVFLHVVATGIARAQTTPAQTTPAQAEPAQAAPAQTEGFDQLTQRIAANPDDTDARYDLARAHLRTGNPTAAEVHFAELLTRDEGNPDWLLGRAQSLLALGRPAEAVPLLGRARARAPGYEDLWRVEAAALESSQQYARAASLLDQASSQFPAATWPLTQREAVRERELLSAGTRASLASSYERLSDSKGEWRSASLDLDHPLNSDARVFAGLHVEERFGTSDGQLALGIVRRFGAGWVAAFGADVAPDATVLPENSYQVELGHPVAANVGLSLRARHARHETVTVNVVAATADLSTGDHRFAYTLTATQPTDLDTSFGHSVRISRDYGSGSHVSLALAHGEEAETIAPGRVLVTRVDAVALMGVHWKSAAWGAAWEIGWHKQGDLYHRMRVRLGLEHRF